MDKEEPQVYDLDRMLRYQGPVLEVEVKSESKLTTSLNNDNQPVRNVADFHSDFQIIDRVRSKYTFNNVFESGKDLGKAEYIQQIVDDYFIIGNFAKSLSIVHLNHEGQYSLNSKLLKLTDKIFGSLVTQFQVKRVENDETIIDI